MAEMQATCRMVVVCAWVSQRQSNRLNQSRPSTVAVRVIVHRFSPPRSAQPLHAGAPHQCQAPGARSSPVLPLAVAIHLPPRCCRNDAAALHRSPLDSFPSGCKAAAARQRAPSAQPNAVPALGSSSHSSSVGEMRAAFWRCCGSNAASSRLHHQPHHHQKQATSRTDNAHRSTCVCGRCIACCCITSR